MEIQNKIASLLASLIICASFCAAQQPAFSAPQQSPAVAANHIQLVIEGKVINVHDGDTITVLDQDNKKFHIRLQGIDAPELKQEFGSVSQQNLSRLVLGKQVSIYWSKVDKYRRTVGTIMLDGHDVNIEQVKAGLAWHFKKYEDEQSPQDRITYAAAEQTARAAKLGLWQDANPTVPGDWRQAVKTQRWGPPPSAGTIIGNKNSLKYHRPDCAGYRDMAEKNRVFFKSVAEAEAAGYKRAGNCPAEIVTSAPNSTVGRQSPAASASSNRVPAPASARVPIKTTVQARPVQLSENETPAFAATGTIIGNKNSKVYHLPGCASYNRVSEKNQVKFATIAEAESAGYKLASNCSKNK
ncbi:MAG TPA: hypothetical protein DC047_15320 [Blastocatellia bacterium]|nr:hypothetical protein [Blastocatellia bacterium]